MPEKGLRLFALIQHLNTVAVIIHITGDLLGQSTLLGVRLTAHPHIDNAFGAVEIGRFERHHNNEAEHRAQVLGYGLLQLNAARANGRVRILPQLEHSRLQSHPLLHFPFLLLVAFALVKYNTLLSLALMDDELPLEVSQKLGTLLLLVQLDNLDVFELLFQAKGECEPASVVGVSPLPEVELAFNCVLNFVLFLVTVLPAFILLLLGLSLLVNLPVFAYE